MTRKKSSKFSADASCPISAGDTGSLIKQRDDAQTEGRAMHKYFVKENRICVELLVTLEITVRLRY